MSICGPLAWSPCSRPETWHWLRCRCAPGGPGWPCTLSAPGQDPGSLDAAISPRPRRLGRQTPRAQPALQGALSHGFHQVLGGIWACRKLKEAVAGDSAPPQDQLGPCRAGGRAPPGSCLGCMGPREELLGFGILKFPSAEPCVVIGDGEGLPPPPPLWWLLKTGCVTCLFLKDGKGGRLGVYFMRSEHSLGLI